MLQISFTANTQATPHNIYRNTYHVHQALGNDDNKGTKDKPFATISKCAELAHAGDTCLVHAGIYREIVQPHKSGHSGYPITFKAAVGEKVIVTGLDKLTSSWKKFSSSIYVTKIDSHVKQLFIGDSPMKIAQFPNSDNYFKPVYATITSAQCKTHSGLWSSNRNECKIYDEDGPCNKHNSCWDRSFPKQRWRITATGVTESVHWQGGTIAIIDKGEFSAERAIITQSKPEHGIEFEWFSEKPITPELKFNITNSLTAIDNENEWSYNTDTHELFLKHADLSAPQNLFIRTRDLAFDLRGKKHITITGFEIIAASIETDIKSSNCILDQLVVSYPVYYQMFGAKSNFPGQGANRHNISSNTMGKGITLGGKRNTLQNSTISHSWCDGVTVYGSENIVINNQISDINWSMTACAAVATHGNKHLIKRNSMYDCGRSCLWHQYTFDSVFSYNDIYNACWLGKDCGVTGSYAWYGKNNDRSSDADGNGIGNIMHHNWIHDNKSINGGSCLYLDNNEQDYLLHHNVLWNCKIALIINDTFIDHVPTGHEIYNNTCFDVEYRNSDYGRNNQWQLKGVKYANNLCTTSKDTHYNTHTKAEIEMEYNVSPGNANLYAQPKPALPWPTEALKLIDYKNNDFRPRNNSPACNNGKYIPNITEKILTPAVGAYECKLKKAWKAGPM